MRCEQRRIACTLAAGLLVVTAGSAFAEVVAAFLSEQSHGQAYTFRMPAGCYAALPVHVIQSGTDTLAAPLLRSRGGREGEGMSPVRPEPQLDLALVKVSGALAAPCGSAENLGVDNLDYLLAQGGEVTLHVARTRSTMQQIRMRVSRSNRTYVWLAPISGHQIDEIQQSMSGATFLSDGVPVAMLLSVDLEDGLAQALRFDVIKRLARDRLTEQPARDVGASAISFEVTGWHGESVEASKPPSAVLDGGAWRVKPVARRVELALRSRAPAKIARISVARPVLAEEEPDLLSVWSSAAAGGDWVLLRTCSPQGQADQKLFDCRVVPTDVSALRLDFSRRAGAPVLSIGAIEIR
jgi:hypothetical protein